MSEKYTVVHKKSRVVTEGQPKLPSASTIEYGEIAINYAEGYETLSIKNSNNEIATFSSDNVVNSALTEIQDSIDEIQSALTEDELVISTSLSDLNDRVEGLESVSIPYNTSDLNNDSGFITSADTAHTHTAAEVGAMATSERSNYLPTGTTLDNVADGSTRKLSNYSLTSHTHTAAEVGAMATSERSNYLTTATTIPSVEPYFDDVEYDSNTKRINFKHNGTVKDYVDASDFIKDGMVDSVAISTPTGGTNSGVTCLVVTFNTDAGKDDIEIPLSNIFNPSNYYNKTEADEKFLSISAYTEDEEVVASALNDLNSRIENMSVPQYVSELINDNAYVSSAETEERYSLTSHTHSQYATTAHTHTAAEVGAMATSERSNYLPTGTTLDNVADGSTRKLSNYSTTGHSHTAAEVGAMATSERSNYSTTGHTHTAAEVGAMATSERSNYLPTGTTLDNVADGTTRKLSNYSLTGHTHSEYATTADTANFITSADTPVEIFDIELSYGLDELALENAFTVSTQMYNDMLSAANNGKLPVIRFYAETGDVTLAYFVLRTVNDNGTLVFSGNEPWNVSQVGNPLYFTVVALWMNGGSVAHAVVSVQAMSISERSNYLPTGTTLDNVADGSTRKLSNYSLTSHTHSQYATTADTANVFFAISGTTTYDEITAARNSGKVLLAKDETYAIHTYQSQTYNVGHVFSCVQTTSSGDILVSKLVCNQSNQWTETTYYVPNESDIASSGFTKNGITGINYNGTAVTVTNGVAQITGSTLPTVTSADNGKVMMVVNGAWALVTPTTVYTGSNTPQNSMGNDGDIYLQTE